MLSPVMTSENVKSCGGDRHQTVVLCGGMCIICEHGSTSRSGTNMVRTENYRYQPILRGLFITFYINMGQLHPLYLYDIVIVERNWKAGERWLTSSTECEQRATLPILIPIPPHHHHGLPPAQSVSSEQRYFCRNS